MFNLLIKIAVFAVFLSACATPEQIPYASNARLVRISAARELMNTDENRIAYANFLDAATDSPDDPAPWGRMAQLFFRQGDYGLAIIYADEALKLDASDGFATSIAAVSGLRIASKALIDLKRRNHLNSNSRSDAETLATMLRNEIGEARLVPLEASSKER